MREFAMGSFVDSGWKFAALAAFLVPALARADDWVPIDPENTLYLELSTGLIVIELHPEIAPGHVARVKKLARAGFYDGLKFHRVIDGFMAQGGDPTGTGEGGSKEPDLKAEFTYHQKHDALNFGQTNSLETIGVAGAAVVLTESQAGQFTHPDGLLQSWMPYCRGTAAMARAQDPNSANSQFFIMFSNQYRQLERNYTPWGRVVFGMDAVDKIARGEPPAKPDRIIHAHVGTDVPAAQRKALEELASGSQGMRDLFKAASDIGHGQIDACAVQVPVRLRPAGH
jgi:peptidylprolyl isomerase